MSNKGHPSGKLLPSSHPGEAPRLPGAVLTPSPRVASHWNGALLARLDRAPLELFLRRHSQCISSVCRDPVTESIELVTLFIIDPAVPHRVHWRALANAAYFDAMGQAIARIARSTGQIIHESRLWRVAALRAMGRLLTPVLGIDMAAPVSAAAIAAAALTPARPLVFDDTVDRLAAAAVAGVSDHALLELRALVGERLVTLAERGAANMTAAPTMVTISAPPPSNH